MQNRAVMPSATPNSGIRDNHRRGLVADFLRAKLKSGSRLSVVSAYFTIYAYETLKQHLDQIGHLNFLFGEPRFISSLDPEKTEKKAFILDGNGLQLANHLQQKRVVYVRDDGSVRFSFAKPKQILEIYRLLCSDKTPAHEHLCRLFDAETKTAPTRRSTADCSKPPLTPSLEPSRTRRHPPAIGSRLQDSQRGAAGPRNRRLRTRHLARHQILFVNP